MPSANESAGAAEANRTSERSSQGLARYPRRDGGDAQALGGPAHIKTNNVTFVQQIDSRHPSADLCAHHVHEGKHKFELAAAMRAQDTVAARAVELEDHALVEISRRSFAVVFVGRARSSGMRSRCGRAILRRVPRCKTV